MKRETLKQRLATGRSFDPGARRFELRSGNPERVRATLERLKRWEPLLGPQVIRLLAWDEVSEIIRIVFAAEHLIGIDITGYNPDKDADGTVANALVAALAGA